MENWKAEISKVGHWAVYRMPGYYGVFDHTAPGESLKSCERRARLIAAAPELLAALEGLARYVENSGEAWASLPEWQAASAAIAKARGA